MIPPACGASLRPPKQRLDFDLFLWANILAMPSIIAIVYRWVSALTWAWASNNRLADAEVQTRAEKKGLWADANPDPPSEYRKSNDDSRNSK